MKKIYYLPYSRERLAHSGVRGMKWGSMRWWNPDHTLTDEGRKHYGYGPAREKNSNESPSPLKSISAIESGAKDYGTPEKKIEAVTQDCYLCTSSGIGDRSKDERKRAKEAADLGLKALVELGRLDEEDDVEDDDDWRDWFLYEDQTIGLGMVADLVNQGYSAEQISKMAKIVQDNYWDAKLEPESQADKAAFEVINGDWKGYFETFAKACETVKKNEKPQHGDDHLAHHGIKGQRWGVRRWQNDDGTLTPAGRERYGYGAAKEKTGKKFSLFKEKTPEEKAAAAEKKAVKAEEKTKRKIEALKRDIRENEDEIIESTKSAEAYARKAEEHRAIAEGYQKRSDEYSDHVADLEWTNSRNSKKIEKLERELEKLKARKVSEVEPKLSDLNDQLKHVRDVKIEESETTLRDYFKSANDYDAYQEWFDRYVG